MAPRPYWKGYLKLSLVTCAVSLTPATSDREKLRFHTLNAATGNRVRSRWVDSETGKAVKEGDEVRGYQTGDGTHVMLEDEELESVGLESTHTIDVEQFVPADSIGWIWYDTPYFLVPDDAVAQEAYAVIRAAMEATATVGISRLVLSRRERAVLLEPRGKGIVLWTLRYGDEVRDPAEVKDKAGAEKPDAKAVSMVRKLIEGMTRSWEPSMVEDPVQAKLHELIQSKRKKKGKPKAKARAEAPADEGSNVVSIMDALKRSIAQERK